MKRKRHFYPGRILVTLVLAFILMVSSVCVVNSNDFVAGTQESENTGIPSKEDQIVKNTEPLVEVSDVETPLAQTSVNGELNLWYLLGILILSFIICMAASAHRNRRKNYISYRRVCKDMDEESRKDCEVDA